MIFALRQFLDGGEEEVAWPLGRGNKKALLNHHPIPEGNPKKGNGKNSWSILAICRCKLKLWRRGWMSQ